MGARVTNILIAHAIHLIKREDPLPLTLETKLLQRGIDVSALYAK